MEGGVCGRRFAQHESPLHLSRPATSAESRKPRARSEHVIETSRPAITCIDGRRSCWNPSARSRPMRYAGAFGQMSAKADERGFVGPTRRTRPTDGPAFVCGRPIVVAGVYLSCAIVAGPAEAFVCPSWGAGEQRALCFYNLLLVAAAPTIASSSLQIDSAERINQRSRPLSTQIQANGSRGTLEREPNQLSSPGRAS